MYRNQRKEKAQPHSLMALSMEAAANCYRFDPRDILSYHKEIDDCHLHAGALTSLDYGLSFNNQLPRWLMRSLPEKISAFMGKRRTNIHKLYTELAAKIVNFDSIQEIDKLNRVQQFGISPLPKLQEKYVKYAQQMVGVENLGVEVNKGHELTKLLLCIQRERLWVKQYNKNIDIEYFAGGDGYGIKQEKCADTFDKADSSTPLVGLRRRNAGKVFEVTKVRTGEKSIFARPDRRQAKVLPDKNKGKVSTTKYEGEGDDDEGSVLYGLICA